MFAHMSPTLSALVVLFVVAALFFPGTLTAVVLCAVASVLAAINVLLAWSRRNRAV